MIVYVLLAGVDSFAERNAEKLGYEHGRDGKPMKSWYLYQASDETRERYKAAYMKGLVTRSMKDAFK